MPIRFRCPYCQQLLGIARRKAGSQVACPTCQAQVLVPDSDPQPAPAPATGPERPFFERSDFEALFQPTQHPTASPPAAAAAPREPAEQRVPTYDVERLNPKALAPADPRPPGVLLSPSQATLLTVAAVFLLAIAFGAGLLVGRYCL
jgi:hypothetical protein